MPRLLGNTLTLVLGVCQLLGVSLCEFPGRRWLDWELMLPFEIPAYVLAFVFVGLLDFAGPVQTLPREWFGTGLRLPRVRSTSGVVTVLVLVFYPLPAGAQRIPGSGQRLDGSGVGAGAIAMANVLACGIADGAASDWCRRGLGVDGDAGRFWRGLGVQFRHFPIKLGTVFSALSSASSTGQPAAGGDAGAVWRTACAWGQPSEQ
jgi:hypothetical protein